MDSNLDPLVNTIFITDKNNSETKITIVKEEPIDYEEPTSDYIETTTDYVEATTDNVELTDKADVAIIDNPSNQDDKDNSRNQDSIDKEAEETVERKTIDKQNVSKVKERKKLKEKEKKNIKEKEKKKIKEDSKNIKERKKSQEFIAGGDDYTDEDPDFEPIEEKKVFKKKIKKEKLNKNIKKESDKYKKKHKLKRKKDIKKEKLKKRKIKKRILLIPSDYKVSKEVEDITNATAYYACAACDEKFHSADGLQRHVLTHTDRCTSYAHRVKNQELRTKLKEEQRKLKNLKTETDCKLSKTENEVKIKEEIVDPDYIDGLVNNSEITQNNTDITQAMKDCSTEIGQILEQLEEHETDRLVTKIMKIHVKSEEADNLEKIFKCGVCGKRFTLNYYLRLHVRSHTGERPYKCTDCPSSFVTASHLGRHRKRSHLSVKYECRICRRPYTRLEFLQKHFHKQHASEKIDGEPYDYNLILPYLKELEVEMEAKKIADAAEKHLRAEQEARELISCPELVREELARKNKEVPKLPTKIPKFETITQSDSDSDDDNFPAAGSDDGRSIYLDEEILKEDPDDLDEPDDPVSWPEEPSFIEITPSESPVSIKIEKRHAKDVKKLSRKAKNDLVPKDEEDKKDIELLDDVKEDFTDDDDYFPDDTWVPDVDLPDVKKPIKRPYTRRVKGESLVCPHCNKEIKSPTYFKVHIRTHTGERPYKCDICMKRFITASKRNRHLLTHSPDELQERLERKVKLEDVKQEDEEGAEAPKKRRRRNKAEMSRSKQERPYSCEFCNKKFVYQEALLVHQLVHTNEVTTFTCSFCLVSFEDSATLAQHEREHTGPRPYLCTLCGKDYKAKDTMIYHRRMHTAEKKFQCEVCPKSFDAQCKLDRHLMCHRAEKFAMRYECPVCAHMFKTKWHIEMHLQSHEREGVILPENRGHIIAMVLQNARKIPLEGDAVTLPIPKDERSRVCNICGEVFHHFFFLEQHLKTHGTKFSIEHQDTKEEKKYICKVCNKGFKLSYYLKLHTYTHSKEKPYICQQCGKGFITRGKLNRHIESHTGLKKYQCHVCCKFFTRPSYLRIHVRTIHGTQDYNMKFDSEFAEFALNVVPPGLGS